MIFKKNIFFWNEEKTIRRSRTNYTKLDENNVIDEIVSPELLLEHCLYSDAIYDFLVWLRTGSNPAHSNRYRRHTGRQIKH